MNSSPDCKWLVLVPTQLELNHIRNTNTMVPGRPDTRVELCGFGPIAAAAKSSQLIYCHRPQRVVLIGIAGSYNEETIIGSAYSFQDVACFGVGIGFGADYRSAESAGWLQWRDENADRSLGDSIQLEPASNGPTRRTLVTSTTASGSIRDVRQRTSIIKNADAEDMEGYAVAVACAFARTPLTVVRGISNRSGDRNLSNWRIADALTAATQRLETIVEG